MEKPLNCFICKGTLSLAFSKGVYFIYKCQNCGLGVTINSKIQKSDYHRDKEYIEENKLFANIFSKRVKIISKLLKPGKVLEVGCSTGLLLSQLKKKTWKVQGIELSSKAAKVADEKGIHVIVNAFEKTIIKDKYNLVIYNHVLEHLENPEGILQKTNSILLDKGMVLISLPNFSSFSANFLKANWPLLLPEEHLWQFTRKSLEILLNKTGFKIIYEEYPSGIWDYGNPWLEIFQSGIGLKKRFFTNIITMCPDFILTKLNLGSGMILIVQKK